MLEAFDGKAKFASWHKPQSYHVTQLFVGGNKAQMETPIYKHYEVGKEVEVVVKAVVYVPSKILTAITFPKAAVQNAYPHMTLFTGEEWKPVLSNSVLEKTCGFGLPFNKSYETLRYPGDPGQFVQHASNVDIVLARNKRVTAENVYLISFAECAHVRFRGTQGPHY
mmetsp:Transcript_18974/g.32416  ORF Transcript_18974/g.32416 Transcript_18974/m.32416 type:complete len:167 (-) Transcript_18974:50-550(-)